MVKLQAESHLQQGCFTVTLKKGLNHCHLPVPLWSAVLKIQDPYKCGPGSA